ncbi:MAG: hypothetical protein ACM3X9_03290 [Bacillota bacterium]
MKRAATIFCCCGLLIALATQTFGAVSNQSTTDRKLNELTNRFSNLESTWGRFQIGGSFELDTTSTLSKDQDAPTPPGFNQQLGLFFDANIDPNLQVSLKVSQEGGWGLNYLSAGSSNVPLTTPFQVDEAFLRLTYPDSYNYLGRFRFSLGPIGLISDFYANPVEGVAIQKAFHNYHVIGVYSRVNTQYKPGTNEIEATEDYFSARVGWSDQNTMFGLNLVPNGITGEKAASIDWSSSTKTSKIAAELGEYSFDSSQYPDYKVDWTPGFLISYAKVLANNNFLQLKAGYFGPQFMPSYSSLAHSSGDDREWFIPNSQGLEIYLQTPLKKGYSLENRLIFLTPVENYNQPDLNYRLRSDLVKNFSPVNQIQIGFDLKYFPDNVYNQIFLNWILQF